MLLNEETKTDGQIHFKSSSFFLTTSQQPLDGALTLLDWLTGKGETSFTFSLLTFSWRSPNKGKYSVDSLACWLWEKNKNSLRFIEWIEARSWRSRKHKPWRSICRQTCVWSWGSSALGWLSDESPWTPAALRWPLWAAARPGSGSYRSRPSANNPCGGLRGQEEDIITDRWETAAHLSTRSHNPLRTWEQKQDSCLDPDERHRNVSLKDSLHQTTRKSRQRDKLQPSASTDSRWAHQQRGKSNKTSAAADAGRWFPKSHTNTPTETEHI